MESREPQPSDLAALRLAAIVDSSDDAIVSKDLDGIIQTWNRGAERLFGYTAAEAVGQPIAMLVPLDRPNEESDLLARLRRGERVEHYETVRVRKDGQRIDISVTISPIRDATGRIIGASKIARDITERKRAEAQLRRALSDLRQAVADRDTLLREVDHRAKNNLQMICDMLFLEAERLDEAAGRAALERSYTRVYAFARLHEQLHRSLRGGQICFGDYLAGVVGGFRQVYPEANIRLDLPPDPLGLDMDRTLHVGLIVNELVANAARHAFAVGAPGEIGIAVRVVEDRIELRIWDTGKGLPASFDPAHASTLGFRIVTLLARRLDAQVSVGDGPGTRFRISFPLAQAA